MATIRSEVATGRRINGRDGLIEELTMAAPSRHLHSLPQSSRHPPSPAPPSETPCFRSSTSPAHPPQSGRPASRRRSGSPASLPSKRHSPSAPQRSSSTGSPEDPAAAYIRTLLLHQIRRRLSLLQQINEVPLRPRLQRRRRNHNRVLLLLQNQPHIHKLIRKQCSVRIVEHRLRLHRAGRRIDLVVHRQQTSARQMSLRRTIERLHRQPSSATRPLQHLGQLILR